MAAERLLPLLLLAACADEQRQAPDAPPPTGRATLALTIEARDTAGVVQWIAAQRGKPVLVNFWATWCGPCIAELPNVIKTYEKYHDQGFEILGISFDKENFAEKLAKFTQEKKMPWPQVYDGKFWQSEIGQLYQVEGIPFMLVVDGDTGEILASNVRGDELGKAVEKAIAKKKPAK